MPTYEYACEKCGHQFEKYQSMKDDALKVCPEDLCAKKKWGKGKVRRAVGTGAGLIFKGSGFYITDYRSEGYKASEKKESSAATTAPAVPAASPASGTGGSETKPAPAKPAPAKTETKASPKTPAK
jgi:putative FmdB family regulatory protein